jgi:urease accessory protein
MPMSAVPTELLLMLLADARLPVAGHTQSGGLEPAVADGLTAAEVPLYLAARLRTVVRVEAGCAVVALHCLKHELPLEPVVRAWAARTPSAALRRSSRAQARAFLRLAGRLWPDSGPVRAVAEPTGAPRSVAIAAAAATAGLGPASLARLIGYDDVQTVAAAALKLLPLDPMTATGWVHDALPAVDEVALAVADLTSPAAVPATGSPQTELWAEAHANTTRRLFSA